MAPLSVYCLKYKENFSAEHNKGETYTTVGFSSWKKASAPCDVHQFQMLTKMSLLMKM